MVELTEGEVPVDRAGTAAAGLTWHFMRLTLKTGNYTAVIDTDQAVEISIPLAFNGSQPNHYEAPAAECAPLSGEDFIGDTRQGGSCNVDMLRLVPHCNGTHTECAGHILNERYAITDTLGELLFPASLLSVRPVRGEHTADRYDPPKSPDDQMITCEALEAALETVPADFLHGVVLRTLPNDPDKQQRNYMYNPPPYLSLDAMRQLSALPVYHLMVDLPSVDRMFDDGKLNAHHIFWNIEPQSRVAGDAARLDRSITEMIYVPEEVPDGLYLASIHIPPFRSDAAPSRVLLYPVREIE